MWYDVCGMRYEVQLYSMRYLCINKEVRALVTQGCMRIKGFAWATQTLYTTGLGGVGWYEV